MGLRWSGGTLQAGRLRRLSNGQHPTGASSLTCPGSALAAYLARMHGLTGLRVRQDQWSFNWSTTCNQKWWQRGGSETGTWHSVDHDMRRCEGRHAGHVTRKSMMPWCPGRAADATHRKEGAALNRGFPAKCRMALQSKPELEGEQAYSSEYLGKPNMPLQDPGRGPREDLEAKDGT